MTRVAKVARRRPSSSACSFWGDGSLWANQHALEAGVTDLFIPRLLKHPHYAQNITATTTRVASCERRCAYSEESKSSTHDPDVVLGYVVCPEPITVRDGRF